MTQATASHAKRRKAKGGGPAPARIPGTGVLGLRVRRKDELVRRVQAGFDYDRLARLEKKSGLSREQMAEFVSISKRTLARRQRDGRLRAEESDRLLRAARVFEMAVELFEGETDRARGWLETTSSALGGASPLAFAATDVGAREVENLIGRLEHGIFT